MHHHQIFIYTLYKYLMNDRGCRVKIVQQGVVKGALLGSRVNSQPKTNFRHRRATTHVARALNFWRPSSHLVTNFVFMFASCCIRSICVHCSDIKYGFLLLSHSTHNFIVRCHKMSVNILPSNKFVAIVRKLFITYQVILGLYSTCFVLCAARFARGGTAVVNWI